MRIFSVVPIEVGHSLLLMLPGQPILDEILDLGDIHELNIVHMTIFLSLDHHIRRHTLVAHSFRIGLMTFAGSIHLIANSRRRKAVVALDLSRVYSLTLELLLLQPVIEGYVGSIRDELFIQAMHALGIRTMLA